MAKPVLVESIPDQIVNEMASFGPLDLKKFIQSPDGSTLQFSAELKSGQALPKGMILTSDGILTGIPGKDTQGVHEIVTTINSESDSLVTTFVLMIKPSLANNETAYVEKLKAQVWEAVNQSLPIPPIGELLTLPITKLDIYYILELWGTLTIWDAFNLDPPHEKHLLKLEGASEHYYVYDRGSSLIMCPKNLFSHERTIRDGLKTARAMAREIYKRDWTIEMAGLDKWTRAAWVELQRLGDLHGKRLEIINYQPSQEEIRAYSEQVAHPSPNAPE